MKPRWYTMDVGDSSVVVVCSLCDWRGGDLHMEDARIRVELHQMDAHPDTPAAENARLNQGKRKRRGPKP